MTTWSNKIAFLVVAGFTLLMVNCAGTPDKSPTQKAQHAYNKIEDDTLVVKNASKELLEARESLAEARKAVGRGDDSTSVRQLANIAEQRVKIAKKTAELRATQKELDDISSELRTLTNNLHKMQEKRLEAGFVDMDIKQRIKYLNNFNVHTTTRGITLRFLGVTFESDKAYLSSSAERAINELADLMDQYPKRNIQVEGYTDNTGAASYNKQLSQKRADAVRQALISRGVDAYRVHAVGLGEQYPIASNESETGRMRNRRVEVLISDENGTFPDIRQ